MPSSFSIAPGISAMKGSGASTAASGIQLWNGIEPALEMAPTSIKRNATAPLMLVTDSGCAVSPLNVSSCAFHQTMPMPAIRHRSVTPWMKNALTAVL